MKKTLLKILGTIVAIILFMIAQGYMRNYFNIDPRIWFLILFFVAFLGIIVISYIFDDELERMKKYLYIHPNSDFESEFDENNIMKRFKKIFIEKIEINSTYLSVRIILTMLVCCGVFYQFFFFEDFWSRTTVNIIFLIIMVFDIIMDIIEAIFSEKTKKRKWIFIGLYIVLTGIQFIYFFES